MRGGSSGSSREGDRANYLDKPKLLQKSMPVANWMKIGQEPTPRTWICKKSPRIRTVAHCSLGLSLIATFIIVNSSFCYGNSLKRVAASFLFLRQGHFADSFIGTKL